MHVRLPFPLPGLWKTPVTAHRHSLLISAYFASSVFEHAAIKERYVLKKALRDHLSASFPEQALRQWFDPLSIVMSNVEKRLSIFFPHPFFAHWFQQNAQNMFENSLRDYLGEGYRLDYSTRCAQRSQGSNFGALPMQRLKNLDLPYGKDFTFDTFLHNRKNEFPVVSAREVAKPGCMIRYNPFVLCGASGTGKTHLLRAMGNEIARHTDPEYIFLGTVEDLAAIYGAEYQADTHAARRHLARHAYFLLDDIQRFKDFPALQEEMIFLFNILHDSGRQMVFTSSGPISGFEFMDQKLRSRLEWGLIAQIKPQDLDIRVRFVQQRLKQDRLRLSKEQVFMLCQRFPDFRHLQGVLTKLAAFRDLMSKDVTDKDFEQILAHTDHRQGSSITPETVITIIAEHFSLTPKDITGSKRHQKVVQARQLAMFICRQLLGSSYPSLGRLFGGKDHSTAMYAVKKVKELQESNKDTKLLVTELKKKCLTRDG